MLDLLKQLHLAHYQFVMFLKYHLVVCRMMEVIFYLQMKKKMIFINEETLRQKNYPPISKDELVKAFDDSASNSA